MKQSRWVTLAVFLVATIMLSGCVWEGHDGFRDGDRREHDGGEHHDHDPDHGDHDGGH